MHDTWQESNTDTHSSMQLEREWVVQGGRILGLVTAGKPNEKREEQQMRSQWTMRTRRLQEKRVQERARDDLLKKYHKWLSSSSTCPTAVPGYGLCHRDCPGGLVEHLGENSCLHSRSGWDLPPTFSSHAAFSMSCRRSSLGFQRHHSCRNIQGQPCTHSCGNILENRLPGYTRNLWGLF